MGLVSWQDDRTDVHRHPLATYQWDITNAEVSALIRENFGEISGTRYIIQLLRRRGYRLGLLSVHAAEWVAHLDGKFKHHQLFDHCSYSFATGYLKPEPEAFLAALKELDTKPEDAVFIDDMSKNVAAAVSLGMAGIHFKKPRQLLSELYRLKLL